eukprot:493485_1
MADDGDFLISYILAWTKIVNVILSVVLLGSMINVIYGLFKIINLFMLRLFGKETTAVLLSKFTQEHTDTDDDGNTTTTTSYHYRLQYAVKHSKTSNRAILYANREIILSGNIYNRYNQGELVPIIYARNGKNFEIKDNIKHCGELTKSVLATFVIYFVCFGWPFILIMYFVNRDQG